MAGNPGNPMSRVHDYARRLESVGISKEEAINSARSLAAQPPKKAEAVLLVMGAPPVNPLSLPTGSTDRAVEEEAWRKKQKDHLTTMEWRQQRHRCMQRDGFACVKCGSDLHLEVDHIVERADWPAGMDGLNELDNLQTLCQKHHAAKTTRKRANRAKHAHKAGSLKKAYGRKAPTEAGVVGVAETTPEDGVIGWLEDNEHDCWGLREMSEAAIWPRLMTKPHPKAVGSYGPEFLEWADERAKDGLHGKRTEGHRWWQELVAYRALEYDKDGILLWRTVIITVARQSGKSWLLRELLLWRAMHPEYFNDEPQEVISLAHKLQTATQLWKPAARYAARYDAKVRYANGQEGMEFYDGSTWSIHAANDGAAVGFTISMILVDEAWRVGRDVVDGALTPTMAETYSPQMYLVSTAGDATSDLMIQYRKIALEQLDEPESTLLIEWSAPPNAELDDEDNWRFASPEWSDNRKKVVADARSKATDDEFRTQWLNIWVKSKMGGNPWVTEEDWDLRYSQNAQPVTGIVLGLEDYFGRGAALAVAGWDLNGRLVVTGSLFPDRVTAIAEAVRLAGMYGAETLAVGASLADDPQVIAIGIPLHSCTITQTKTALSEVRTLLSDGSLIHDGAEELRDQVTKMQVIQQGTGLSLPVRQEVRTDLARAAGWAVLVARRAPQEAPAVW